MKCTNQTDIRLCKVNENVRHFFLLRILQHQLFRNVIKKRGTLLFNIYIMGYGMRLFSHL